MKRALKPVGQEKRTPEQQKALEKAVRETEHNYQIMVAIWEGKKSKLAAMYEDEGGEMKRVGWPNGYKPEQKKGFTQPTKPAVPKPKGQPPPTSFSGKKIRLQVDKNPKKPGTGSFKAWELYKDGMSTDEFFSSGGTIASLKWDCERGFIRLE